MTARKIRLARTKRNRRILIVCGFAIVLAGDNLRDNHSVLAMIMGITGTIMIIGGIFVRDLYEDTLEKDLWKDEEIWF